ncbi:peptide deformylase [Porphyromonas canoris]|uniref:Peptide deformylase n=1 Tax=Porphyromonas canoris TaxID=36875 RepID=A0ABR4XMS0_9PORP|nr:peptide deformylase [Porphyromonas canoris]KGN93396.1 peptide deformylase [Porphyromonas canoris]
MILPIYLYGTDVLRRETAPIEEINDSIKKLIDDMFETMYHADGIGLAAPQIGKSLKLLVIDADPLGEDYPECKGFKRVIINPEILESNETTVSLPEGCLSIPGISENVVRPTQVKIRYRDENFEEKTETLNDFAARVFQHEHDHITQTLFTDRVSPLRKQLIKNKLLKISKGIVNCHYRTVNK